MVEIAKNLAKKLMVEVKDILATIFGLAICLVIAWFLFGFGNGW